MRVPANLAILAIVLQAASGEITDGDSLLDRFRYGIELVHRLFDTDAASHFGAFFSSFKDKKSNSFLNRNREDFANSLFGAIVKSIGGSQKEMARAGVKVSVTVAKMISDAFSQTGRSSRSAASRGFSPLNSLFQQTRVKELMTNVKDPNLTERIGGELAGPGRECLQLLFCKMSPFVKGMQKSLNFFAGVKNEEKGRDAERETWARSRPVERMYLFLPGLEEFLENGDACDDRHPLCLY